MSKALSGLLTLVLVASTSANVAVNFTPVDNSSAPQLAGYVTQDIRVLTTNDWSSSAIYLTLTSGSVYQDASLGAGVTPPPSWLIDLSTTLRYDTYVGILDDPTSGVAGAAGDVGGPGNGYNFRFDNQVLDVTWSNLPDVAHPDAGLTNIGRLSLSNDAQGSVAFSISEVGKQLVTYAFDIVNGQVIPNDCSGIGGDVSCGLGLIGLNQLDAVLGHWNQNVASGNANAGDFDHDGFVGLNDLDTVLGFWNLETYRETLDLQWVLDPAEGDGFVGLSDLDLVLGSWNRAVPPGNPLADFDGDGYIGQDDMNVVMSNWNAGTPPAILIPEPMSALGFVGAVGVLLGRRR